MQRPSNPFVFTKKTVFMQRISDAVVNGAARYIQGTIPVSKAGKKKKKMKERYEYDLSYKEASRKRKLGYATAKLLFWHPEKGCETLNWILLVTNGKFKDGVGLDEDWLDPKYKGGCGFCRCRSHPKSTCRESPAASPTECPARPQVPLAARRLPLP